jgi:hypothetical protein
MAKKNDYACSVVRDRIDYVKDVIAAMTKGTNINGEKVSAATIKTQTVLRVAERDRLILLKELLEHAPEGVLATLSTTAKDAFNTMTKAPSANKTVTLDIKVGDDVFAFITKNPSVSLAQVQKYLDRHDMFLQGSKVAKKV